MPRPTTRDDLILKANSNFDNLWQTAASMNKEALKQEFDFSGEEKKKEAHWLRDKNLRDVYIHLYEWHRLLLNWISSNMEGVPAPFLPSPYNWKTYGEMNREFWVKHQETSLEDAESMLISSHKEVIKTISALSNEELFSKGHFTWTGSTTLGSYYVSASSSHYEWAVKKLKAHNRKF